MDWVARYLDHVRYEKRLAERTHALYTLDLEKLSDYAKDAGVALEAVQATHIRAGSRRCTVVGAAVEALHSSCLAGAVFTPG